MSEENNEYIKVEIKAERKKLPSMDDVVTLAKVVTSKNIVPCEFLNDEVLVDSSSFVRRSIRDPAFALLERRDVKLLIERISQNHEDSIVLKIKDFVLQGRVYQ